MLGILLYMLAGPTRVDESPGDIRRPDLFALIDSSASMAIGNETTRLEDAVNTLEQTAAMVRDPGALASLKLFQFGHRLSTIEAPVEARDSTPPSDENSRQALSTLLHGDLQATATDTRLAEALRQLTGRFGREPPSGVVLFSDGRVRDAETVEQIARFYAERKVPLHVFPLGDNARGGDVAIVSIVAPEKVRKYTDVDVQVFFRSFGYSGKRTEVQLVVPAAEGRAEEILASLPVTLRGGAQSATLTFRADTRGRAFEVRIPPQEDELTSRNNVTATEVRIDRTKIRVLYVEGSEQPIQILQSIGATAGVRIQGPHTAMQTALSEDEDIECVPFVRESGRGELVRVQSYQGSSAVRAFPATVAELSAFDCILLSNVGPDAFEEHQLEWLRNWVENRGAGLVMIGGPNSYGLGGWQHTNLGDVLPVGLEEDRQLAAADLLLRPQGERTHSLWQIVSDKAQNKVILDSIPPIGSAHTSLTPKPLTEVISTTTDDAGNQAAAIVAGSFGRGRTLAISFPAVGPAVDAFLEGWGTSGNRYAAKFWRNVVYWATESSSIGRRRLIASVDKRFYRPGETISLNSFAFDETARRTTDYSVWGMLEPLTLDFDEESLYAPVHWPNGVPRESGEEGPHVAWGEEFELPRNSQTGNYELPLELTEQLIGGKSDQGLRLELTAYEGGGEGGYSRGTQVDSTSLEIQILDDPFEQQNPFPNHDLLRRLATVSGGQELHSPSEIAAMLGDLPVEAGAPVVKKSPSWNHWGLWGVLLGLLSAEWIFRRLSGMA